MKISELVFTENKHKRDTIFLESSMSYAPEGRSVFLGQLYELIQSNIRWYVTSFFLCLFLHLGIYQIGFSQSYSIINNLKSAFYSVGHL